MDTLAKITRNEASKLFAAAITGIILLLLVISGPVNAFSVSLTGFGANSNPSKGEIITTNATITVDNNEILTQPIKVYLDDFANSYCDFDLNANNITCSPGVFVQLVSSTNTDYGYGYGYGYGSGSGTYTYTITIDTSSLSLGKHTMLLSAQTADNTTSNSSDQSFTVTETNPLPPNPDTISPIVTLESLQNNTFVNISSLSFSFIETDNQDPFLGCSFYMDNSLKLHSLLALNNVTAYFNYSGDSTTNHTIKEGLHNWHINCMDAAGNIGFSKVLWFTVDKTKPTVKITSPSNSTQTNNSSPSINFTISDNLSPSLNWALDVNLVQNNAGTVQNKVNGTDISAAPTLTTNGTYTITATATDEAGNTGSDTIILNVGLLNNSNTNNGNNTNTTSPINNTNVTLPTILSNETQNYSGNNSILTFNNITLDMNSTGTGNISVTEFSSSPINNSTGPLSVIGLGKWFEINASNNITNSMGLTLIKVFYTDAEVSSAGINESTLRLYYYNTTSNSWAVYDTPNGGVNTTANFVWALTDHFSVWGVYGNAVPVSQPSDASSGSGSGSSGGSGGGSSSSSNVVKTQNVTPTRLDTTLPNAANTTTNSTSQTPSQTNNKSLFSTITGAVTGALGNTSTIIIIAFVIVLIILLLAVRIIRKRRNYIKINSN